MFPIAVLRCIIYWPYQRYERYRYNVFQQTKNIEYINTKIQLHHFTAYYCTVTVRLQGVCYLLNQLCCFFSLTDRCVTGVYLNLSVSTLTVNYICVLIPTRCLHLIYQSYDVLVSQDTLVTYKSHEYFLWYLWITPKCQKW